MPDPKRFPTVLLRHDLPDGSHHFDWMLARDDHGPLLTFRLDRDIGLDPGPFQAAPIGDHRRVYLEREGPVSGNRGTVSRIACGWCVISESGPTQIRLTLDLGCRRAKLRGIRQADGRFLFEDA
jgi:hypothetical protein